MGIRGIVACAGALCLLLAGCGAPSPGAGGTGDWVTASAEALKEQGTALVNDMEQGDFAAVVGAFDDTMRSSLSEEKLAETWHTAVDAKGAFESITGASVNSAQGYGVTTVVARHAGGSVAVQFSFSSDRRVGGLYLRDAGADDIAAATATSDATAAPGATTAPEPTGPHSVDHPVAVGPHQLNGTLVTPKPDVQDRRIVVVLVSGSGPNDMDETVGANKPMRDIADGLAQAGISSLRYNKRYNQDPSADAGAWTLESEVLDDLDAALQMLPSSEAAGYSVVVAGHSLGGMLLPTILARHPEVAAGISLAGSPRDLFDIMTDQTDAQIQSSDAGDDEKASARATQSAALAAAKALTDPNGEPGHARELHREPQSDARAPARRRGGHRRARAGAAGRRRRPGLPGQGLPGLAPRPGRQAGRLPAVRRAQPPVHARERDQRPARLQHPQPRRPAGRHRHGRLAGRSARLTTARRRRPAGADRTQAHPHPPG